MPTVVITGANRGIGLELAKQFTQRGDDVVAVCRKKSPELDKLGAEVLEGVDVTDDAAVAKLVKGLKGRTVDVVVNCAGILSDESLADLDFDRMRRQFEVNSLGPLRVISALLPNMHAGSKIALITSRMGSIEDNTSGGRYGYRMSKAAVNMAGKSLSIDLREAGIGVFLLHPGYVATGMTGGQGIPAGQAAAGLVERMDTLQLEQTGTFWHQEGYALPW